LTALALNFDAECTGHYVRVQARSPGRGFGMPAGQIRGLTYQIAAAPIWTGCGDLV
jgi:hypothetical protein